MAESDAENILIKALSVPDSYFTNEDFESIYESLNVFLPDEKLKSLLSYGKMKKSPDFYSFLSRHYKLFQKMNLLDGYLTQILIEEKSSIQMKNRKETFLMRFSARPDAKLDILKRFWELSSDFLSVENQKLYLLQEDDYNEIALHNYLHNSSDDCAKFMLNLYRSILSEEKLREILMERNTDNETALHGFLQGSQNIESESEKN